MQEIIVALILALAIAIIWKRMAPRALRVAIYRAMQQAAQKMGNPAVARKLEEKAAGIAAESGCSACGSCPKPIPSGCESPIPVKIVRKK